MSQKINIRVDKELSDDFIGDILVTAFDGSCGGCWYWARPYRMVDGKSAWVMDKTRDLWISVTISDKERHDGMIYIVDHAVIVTGIIRAFESTNTGEEFRAVREGVLTDDAGMIDSGAADVIVQLGLFGAVIYG